MTGDRKRVVLAGGSGFMGSAIARDLIEHGYEPVVLTRGPDSQVGRVRHVHWDGRTPGDWVRELDGALAVVNLVGRSVDCRKNARNRAEILRSRVDSVAALAAGFARVQRPPGVWVQSATAHIYGDTDDEILDESSPIGTGFAPMVGTAWEKALDEAETPGCRKVVLRISFVLGRHGGALRTLSRLARFYLGGTVGSGKQYISWIHIDDLCAIVRQAIENPTMAGTYVTTSPQPVTNQELMAELRKAVRRPWAPPAPGWLVRMGSLLLRTDPELALLGRRCVPTRLLNEGFSFKFPALPDAMQNLIP